MGITYKAFDVNLHCDVALKARKSLPAAESLTVMRPLAEALDKAMRDGVLCPELSLLDVFLTPVAPPSTQLDEWPGLAVRLDMAASLDRDAGNSSRTIIPSVNRKRADAGNQRAGYLALAASFTYELLGGPHTNASAGTFTPLPALSQDGNALLGRALDGDPAFACVGDFVRALECSERGTRKPNTHPPAQFASEERARRAGALRIPALLLAACAVIAALAVTVHIFRNPPVGEATTAAQIPPPTKPDAQVAPQAVSVATPTTSAAAPKQPLQETVDSNHSPQTAAEAEAPSLPATPQLPPDPGAEIFAKFKSPIPASAQDVIDRTFARLLSSSAKLVGKQLSFAGQVIGVYSISGHTQVSVARAFNTLLPNRAHLR